jgi:hypothetical protein
MLELLHGRRICRRLKAECFIAAERGTAVRVTSLFQRL